MKTGLAWTAGTAAGFAALPAAAAQKDIAAVSRTSLKELRAVATTCGQCPAGCGVTACLSGDRLVQILGNPHHPDNQGGLCARGIAAINLVNDPERLLFPMKRKGVRGSGQWTRTSWDEVYTTLSRRLDELRKAGRLSEFVVDKGRDEWLLERFINSWDGMQVIDRPALRNISRSTALREMTGSPSLIEDAGRSRTIFNFGANPFSSHDRLVGFVRRLMKARVEKGTRIITFDVRLSETAAQSDAWYPVRAGSDGILALAMARVIVEKGLADSSAIEHHAAVSLSSLREHLSPYTLGLAERECGIRDSEIERLAAAFATEKPSLAIFGGGLSEQENGTLNAQCVILLNWLTGNIEKEGGLFFPRSPAPAKEEAFPGDRKLFAGSRILTGISDLLETQQDIDTYFICQANPAFDEPDCRATARLLEDEKKIPLLIVMDTHLTETAMMADIVLPAATYLEGWGVNFASSLDLSPLLNLQQPAVSLLSPSEVLRSPDFEAGKLLQPVFRPRGEAKEVGMFCLELARRIGGEALRRLPYRNTEDWTSRLVSSVPGFQKNGGFNVLKERGFWEITEKGETQPLKNRQAFPASLPRYPVPELPRRKKENEFVLSTFKSSLGSAETANSKWAREIMSGNRLWINKERAAQLGIRNGDRVRLISSAGTLCVRALTTHRIHPESAALAEGFGHTAVGNVARARRFKSQDRDTGLIWWESRGKGVNPMEVIERRKDLLSGGLALKSTLVRIEKEGE